MAISVEMNRGTGHQEVSLFSLYSTQAIIVPSDTLHKKMQETKSVVPHGIRHKVAQASWICVSAKAFQQHCYSNHKHMHTNKCGSERLRFLITYVTKASWS